jgi:aerobic carbon-monoxide dehydrogenase medium subunit
MLLNLREYWRPGTVAGSGPVEAGWQAARLNEVLDLLARPEARTVPLAGGDTLLAGADPTVEAVVDLQGLGLDGITCDDACLRIGALATRASLAGAGAEWQSRANFASIGDLLARAAARWAGSVQRNRATVGGAVAVAAGNDPLVAALLAADAVVALYSKEGRRDLPLVEFLAERKVLLAAPALITALNVPLPAQDHLTGAALAIVARTPADAPIVLAAAALTIADGRCAAARLVLGGVAPAPLRLPAAEKLLQGQVLQRELIAAAAKEAAAQVHPAGDFRGGAEYRQAMTRVLSERALLEAWDRGG